MKVATCWDDGIENDIRVAEIFRKYGAKATFNLNPGLMDPVRRGWSGWRKQGIDAYNHNFGFSSGKLSHRDIAEVYQGFELASHCWRHENAGSIPDDDWLKSALDARHFLEDIVQKPCLGFAWPCGVFTDGTITKLREVGFAYGRTTQNTWDVTDCAEPLALASSCHFKAPDFWARYKAAKETGVFYFWGHSYELFRDQEMWNLFDEMISYIASDSDVEWVNVVDIPALLKPKSQVPGAK